MNPSIIQSIENWRTKSPQEILSELQAITSVSRDTTLRSYDGVGEVLGFPTSIALYATMEGVIAQGPTLIAANLMTEEQFATLKYAHASFSEGRMNLSLDFVQAGLDQFAAIPQLAPFIPALKQMGVRTTYPYSSLSLQEVEAAKASILADEAQQARDTQKQQWRSRFDGIMNQLDTVEEAQGLAALTILVNEINS